MGWEQQQLTRSLSDKYSGRYIGAPLASAAFQKQTWWRIYMLVLSSTSHQHKSPSLLNCCTSFPDKTVITHSAKRRAGKIFFFFFGHFSRSNKGASSGFSLNIVHCFLVQKYISVVELWSAETLPAHEEETSVGCEAAQSATLGLIKVFSQYMYRVRGHGW